MFAPGPEQVREINVGYASTWGFTIYRDNVLPSGQPAGTAEEALDRACGLYLGDPAAWLPPPTN
jgi:hypothetical protein